MQLEDEELQIVKEVRELESLFEAQILQLCEKYKHRYLHIMSGQSEHVNKLKLHISIHAIPLK